MFDSCQDFQYLYTHTNETKKSCPHQINNFANVIKAIIVLFNSLITAFSLCKTRTLIQKLNYRLKM